MAKGYDDGPPASHDEGMDEFLCEYVDGTMDPVVLTAFEEYLRSNPQMAAHVQCLCQAKRLLSQQCGCAHATGELQRKLKEAIAREQLGDSQPSMGYRLGSAAWLTSAAGLMLMLGMLFGTAVVQYHQASPAMAFEREAAPSDAHRPATVRFPKGVKASIGLPAPAIVLPSLRSSAMLTPTSWTDSVRVPVTP